MLVYLKILCADILVQDCGISSVLAIEIWQCCTTPAIYKRDYENNGRRSGSS